MGSLSSYPLGKSEAYTLGNGGGVKPPPSDAAHSRGHRRNRRSREKWVRDFREFFYFFGNGPRIAKKLAKKFCAGGIHARARVFVKNPTPNCDLGGPKSPPKTPPGRPVCSQNTSMMCSCIPRTIQEDPRIPTSPNKTSKYLSKPKIYSVRYFHVDMASLIGS